MTTPTTLYRLYSPTDALLYIGVGGNPGRRFQQHRGAKTWWGDIAHIRLEHHPTREAAFAAETAAILTENPRHNIAGRDKAAGVIPDREHRALANGAYLDIENRGDHIYVGINRDDLAVQIKTTGEDWLTPSSILNATHRLAGVATLWLWADGCQEETLTSSCSSFFRSVNVRPELVQTAAAALIASELRGDLAGINQLAADLAATFPSSGKFRPETDYRPNVHWFLTRYEDPPVEGRPWAGPLLATVEKIDARWGQAA